MMRLFNSAIDYSNDLAEDRAGMQGLITCHGIVTSSGGSIEVYLKGQNLGTTFVFSMKMNLPEEVKKIEPIELLDDRDLDVRDAADVSHRYHS